MFRNSLPLNTQEQLRATPPHQILAIGLTRGILGEKGSELQGDPACSSRASSSVQKNRPTRFKTRPLGCLRLRRLWWFLPRRRRRRRFSAWKPTEEGGSDQQPLEGACSKSLRWSVGFKHKTRWTHLTIKSHKVPCRGSFQPLKKGCRPLKRERLTQIQQGEWWR